METCTSYTLIWRALLLTWSMGRSTCTSKPMSVSKSQCSCVIGERIYSLLRDLLALDKPDKKTFQDLAEVLKNHFEPKPLVIAECYYFHTSSQKPTETIAEYVTELCRLVTHCEFGDYLNEVLQDCFMCRLHNSGTQK